MLHSLLSLPLKLSVVNRKQLMQLKLLIFKLVLLNGIVGVILPVNAHSPNEILEQWQADLEVNQLLSQGKKLVEQGKLAEALTAYQHVISLEQENPRVFSAIGYVQATQSNFPAAAGAFQKAIALEPDNPHFYYGLA
jgi:cytochrome c-type biogenesis protein CcmH/NrfG